MVSSELWFGAEAGFYNSVATQSLRFDDGSSAYLTRTPSSASNRRTFTFSAWIKRGVLDADNVGGSNDTPIFSASASGGPFDVLRTLSQLTAGANILQLYANPSGSLDYSEETNASIRDTSAWYHIVMAVDSTQGTAGNRVKFYINGTLQTAVGQHYAQVPQNHDFHFNNTVAQEIGRNAGNTSRYFDGYMAEVNFVDGTQYDASYFGETKNGVWIAIAPNVTYGTEGFRLQFKNTSVGTGSSSTIGADTSGNDNHWTSSGIVASDCNMPDSPENNFCTISPITFPLAAKGTIAEGALKLSGTDHQVQTSTFAIPASGKWYWEVNNITSDGSNHLAQYMGVMSSAIFHAEQDVSTYDGGNYIGTYIRALAGVSWIAGNDNYYSNFNTTTISNGANHAGWGNQANSEGILSLALDVDAGTLKYYWNNSLIRTDSTLTANIEYFAHTNLTNSGGNFWSFATFNFGQDSSFAGAKTAQGNTDANGNGDFYYAVPTGHLALCSANLPEPTIGPNSLTQADDHFNTVLYSGEDVDGSTKAVTVGFKPDFIWGKTRNRTQDHMLANSNVGFDVYLRTNGTAAEATLDSLVNDDVTDTGFLFDDDEDGYFNFAPDSGDPNQMVVWNWHANGGTTSSNTDGSVTTTVQANTTSGFSIVLYTGTGANATFGHGLGAVPKMIITKTRSHSGNWMVYHGANTSAPETDFLKLDTNVATEDLNTVFNDTAPTSSVFTLGSNGDVNTSGRTQVAYVFAEIEGYSKFGSYTGNGNADGTFVYTGFRPAWVMLKNTARGADWRINDSTRQDVNDEGGHLLLANSNSSEITNEYDIDFLSNGFKLRSGDVYENGSGEAFIYMAFAEAPFKYANAR